MERGPPAVPLPDVVLANFGKVFGQVGSGLLACLTPNRAEAQSQDELAVAGFEVDLSGERNVSVLGAVIFPFHLEMLGKILPPIGKSGEAHRHFLPRG